MEADVGGVGGCDEVAKHIAVLAFHYGWSGGIFVGEEEAVAGGDSVFFEDCSDVIRGVEEIHRYVVDLWTCDTAFQWWTLREGID